MKKIILTSCIAASAVFANISDADITELYSGMLQEGVKFKILERGKLENTNFEQIIVEFSRGEDRQKQIIFSDGNYLFPDIIDTKKRTSYASKFNEEQEALALQSNYKKLGEVIKKLDKNRIIELGDEKLEKTTYVFSDPLCPFCRQKIKNIEDQLKATKIKLILTPIPSHGEEAIAKSVAIQKECKNLTNDADKIKVIRKYFEVKAEVPKEITNEEINTERKVISEIFQTGAINGVPAFIEASELEK